MNIEQVITAIGGSAVLFAAMAWLARSILTHVLSKDIDKYKNKLGTESQKELVRLQSSLQLVEFEHQVRFSQLHERKVSIMGEMYGLLVQLHKSAANFVKYYHSVDDDRKNDYIEKLWQAADNHNNYFDKHRIYFNDQLCVKVDNFNTKLSQACSQLVVYSQDAGVAADTNQIYETWKAAMDSMENDVPDIKKQLEEDFRNELGVSRNQSESV